MVRRRSLDVQCWPDRVYGEVAIADPGLLALIACPTFRRLERIRQAGPSALAFPFKTVTRFEHSLGVYHLLERLGAGRREQVAGLLHDVSHTAFSHAADFVYASDEQNHHEGLKPEFLHRPDLETALHAIGFEPEDFYDDTVFPLLEQPLPWLCADRLDYFLRDSLACAVSTPDSIARTLAHVTVRDGLIVVTDADVARDAERRFAAMNDEWWASPTEAYIYNEFADALREGFRLGALHEDDLLTDDDAVLGRLAATPSPLIASKLARITHFRPERVNGYVPRVVPKVRRIDPPVAVDGGWKRLSELSGSDG
jgi:hypothetical protein